MKRWQPKEPPLVFDVIVGSILVGTFSDPLEANRAANKWTTAVVTPRKENR